MTQKLELIFEKERDTKNTVRYAEIGDVPNIGTIYIQKHAVAKTGLKDRIKVTVEPDQI